MVDARGGTWSSTGTIVFAPNSLGGLMKVSDSGGQPSPLTSAATNYSHRWPQFLPDGNSIVYLSIQATGSAGDLLKRTLSNGTTTKIGIASAGTLYTAGRLLFMHGSSLMEAPVKLSTMQPTGDAKTVAENVAADTDRWSGDFTASDNGLLIYCASGDGGTVQFSWMDFQTGKLLASFGDPGAYTRPVISPDGTKLAILATNAGSETPVFSVMDVARGVVTPVLPASKRVRISGYAWTPDSSSLVFAGTLINPNRSDLFIKQVNSSDAPKPLLAMDSDVFPAVVTADRRFVLVGTNGGKATRNDILLLPLAGDRKPVPLLATPADESANDVSEDGRWMLYTSDESGRPELYLTTFPVPHGRWQVSVGGGTGGAFERGGKRIAVVDTNHKVYAVSFDGSGAEPKIGKPETMIGGRSTDDVAGASITPDWKHLAVAQRLQTQAPRLMLITNWTEDLKK